KTNARAGRDQEEQKIAPLEINVGSHTKFECEIEEAPDVAFKWYKSGTEIRQSEKYRIVSRHTSSSLELLNPVKADSGEYTCKASNQHGTDSCTASLIVTVSLRTAFTGTAPLTVKWFREEKEIITGGTYFIKKDASSSSLELHSVDCTVVLFVKGAVFSITCNFINLTSDSATDMILTINLFCLILDINLFYQNLPCL
uniref:Ig-like domain-containing protein n=1 Tax=Neolamprologus brichardi TaxID=32507 RepID=A0A3Q4HEI1_NEOBR